MPNIFLFFIFIFVFAVSRSFSLSVFSVIFIYTVSNLIKEEIDSKEEDSDIEENNRDRIRLKSENSDIGLIYLAAYVMQVENVVHVNQVQFIRNFLRSNFNNEHVNKRLNLLNRLLAMNISYEDGCRRIIYYYPIEQRHKIIDFLFSLAAADGRVSIYEVKAIERISYSLYVNNDIFVALRNKYYKENDTERRQRENREQEIYRSRYRSIEEYYRILEVSQTATYDELKTAYRKKVLQYHPDRYINKSNIEQEKAKIIFIQVQEAFDKIRTEKGYK